MSQPWSPGETRDLVKALVDGALKDRYPSRAVGGNRSLAAAYTKLSRLRDAGKLGQHYQMAPIDEGARRAWGQEELAAVRRLAVDWSVDAKQVGEVIGRTEAAVVAAMHKHRIRASWGHDYGKACRLIADGMSVAKAARQIGRTPKALSRRMEHRGDSATGLREAG